MYGTVCFAFKREIQQVPNSYYVFSLVSDCSFVDFCAKVSCLDASSQECWNGSLRRDLLSTTPSHLLNSNRPRFNDSDLHPSQARNEHLDLVRCLSYPESSFLDRKRSLRMFYSPQHHPTLQLQSILIIRTILHPSRGRNENLDFVRCLGALGSSSAYRKRSLFFFVCPCLPLSSASSPRSRSLIVSYQPS